MREVQIYIKKQKTEKITLSWEGGMRVSSLNWRVFTLPRKARGVLMHPHSQHACFYAILAMQTAVHIFFVPSSLHEKYPKRLNVYQ